MTHLEDRISRALTSSRSTPSPDLFERVLDSIDADRRRRRTGLLSPRRRGRRRGGRRPSPSSPSPPDPNGALEMPWWILEVATTLVLVAMAVWLGPFIKRFGRAYAADVFHDNPLTGKSYIVLTDIVYYLIFAAYILFSVHFSPQRDWHNDVSGLVTPEQLTFSGSADRRHPAHHRHPARAQHRAHAGARPAVLAQPEAARGAARPGPPPLPVSTGAARSVLSSTHVARAGRVDLREVEPLPADVAGVHRGCRVRLLRRPPSRSGRCRAARRPRTAPRPTRRGPRGRPARAGAGRCRRRRARRRRPAPGSGSRSSATSRSTSCTARTHGSPARNGPTSRSRTAAWSYWSR